MNEQKSWLRRPRYSPLELAVFVVIALTVLVLTATIRSRQIIRERGWLATKGLNTNPFPQVIIAPSAEHRDPDAYQGHYRFSKDVFTRQLPIWKKVFEPYRGRPGLNYLEIGVYEGRSLLWMLENVLTDDTARATAVDIFDGPYRDTYASNLERSGSAGKVTTIANYSQIALRQLPLDSFDIIYVDGSHWKADVLEDAVLSWRLLKKGGLLIFDDYLQAERIEGTDRIGCPKVAIDPFVQCFEDECEVIHNEWQLIIRKKG
jgi:SAM-dependent methyltransferase